MPLTALVGPAGSGKTTRLINTLRDAHRDGRQVLLFLCSDAEDLRARPHVKTGGLMGSRTPDTHFEITHFISAAEARAELANLPEGAVAAFDEAGTFGTPTVNSWIEADRAGVDVILSSLSEVQIEILVNAGYHMTHMSIPCMLCGSTETTHHFEARSDHDAVAIAACGRCLRAIDRNHGLRGRVLAVLEDLKEIKPFPGEKRSYQPLYQIEADGWDFVRPDTSLRADIMVATYEEYFGHSPEKSSAPVTYLDLGCATGYFCEHMDDRGFASTGVDIDEDFLRVARNVTESRGGNVEYIRSDALGYIEQNPDQRFDITSSFATVQWVMAQSGLEAGLTCFDWIFGATNQMCVMEIGYSKEEIYSDKLPVTIDATWMRDIMIDRGGFDEVLFFPSAEHTIWRDLFIGLRNPLPVRAGAEGRLPIEDEGTLVRQIGPGSGLWADGWAGARSSFAAACNAPVSSLRVSGMVPDWMAGTSRIRVSSSSDTSSIEVEPGQSFDVSVGIAAQRGDVIRPVIESDNAQPPSNEDARQLGFLLTALAFEPAD